jgi:hypothetical protein
MYKIGLSNECVIDITDTLHKHYRNITQTTNLIKGKQGNGMIERWG